jgi:chemotaxis protein methyltransferase CheR
MKPETADADDRFGRFDIIFCRNVMIYFSSPCQQLLVEALHRLLLPGGYLFTGDAEPLHLFKHDFKQVEEAGCLIYQKMEATADV